MARKRRRYDDKFRTNAVLMLEAAGYPDQKGALTRVANNLKMPPTTLAGWANGQNEPPAELRCEKKADVIEFIKKEIPQVFREMGDARQDASYRDLMVGMGILVDKWLILSGDATERHEIRVEHDIDADTIREALAILGSKDAGPCCGA